MRKLFRAPAHVPVSKRAKGPGYRSTFTPPDLSPDVEFKFRSGDQVYIRGEPNKRRQIGNVISRVPSEPTIFYYVLIEGGKKDLIEEERLSKT